MMSLLSFLLLATICSGHTTHYIKPSPSISCPADSCFTLSEYAQQLPHNLNFNTTLLLLPGDHVLSVNFTVETIALRFCPFHLQIVKQQRLHAKD